ncbi:MAG: hypothetical protein JST82_10050 [Bacteroidetes bacterium]|nr:hypothetical protein [Bacteroidota bacterium]
MDNILNSLSVVYNKYSAEDTATKQRLLLGLEETIKFSTKQLLRYHDYLLFLLAYPDDKSILKLATAELERLTSLISGYSDNNKARLSGSGLPYTTTICSYSFELTKWLSESFGKDVDIDSSGADKFAIRETMRLFFPEPEYWQTTQDELSIERRIRLLKGKNNNSNNLVWLLKQLSGVENANLMQEYLFANLKLFVKWQIQKENSRSYLRALDAPVYYHDDLIKKSDAEAIIEKTLPKPRFLSREEQLQLCNAAKASLALLYRETDPVTYANPKEVVYFELERGISIALYGMKTGKRFSMESYVGYMAFKNGLPVAYGGGWMLGGRCKIGVNIYEPYRGGESAYVFSQIIRAYRQYFGMERFVVKPYQYGKGNPEGIKSGAYWFYYKLGFRSVEKEIATIAKNEWDKITSQKGYRTSEKKLKQLTGCNIELSLNDNSKPGYDASNISMAVTNMINERYAGDRQIATSQCVSNIKRVLSLNTRMNEIQIMHCKQMSLWFSLISDLDNWSTSDKNKLKDLIFLKAGDNERNYILKLKAHKKLWASIQEVIKS